MCPITPPRSSDIAYSQQAAVLVEAVNTLVTLVAR